MHGDRTASIPWAPRRRIASSARSTTPATRPRQPACTTARTRSVPASARRAQSAPSTATGRSAAVVTRASAASPNGPGRPSTTATAPPCTWRAKRHGREGRSAGRSPTAPCRQRRASPSALGVIAARAPPPRVAAGRPGPLAEEGGDVEVVVTEVDLVAPHSEDIDRRALGLGTTGRLLLGARAALRGALLEAIEARGDDGDPHRVAER